MEKEGGIEGGERKMDEQTGGKQTERKEGWEEVIKDREFERGRSLRER